MKEQGKYGPPENTNMPDTADMRKDKTIDGKYIRLLKKSGA